MTTDTAERTWTDLDRRCRQIESELRASRRSLGKDRTAALLFLARETLACPGVRQSSKTFVAGILRRYEGSTAMAHTQAMESLAIIARALRECKAQ